MKDKLIIFWVCNWSVFVCYDRQIFLNLILLQFPEYRVILWNHSYFDIRGFEVITNNILEHLYGCYYCILPTECFLVLAQPFKEFL